MNMKFGTDIVANMRLRAFKAFKERELLDVQCVAINTEACYSYAAIQQYLDYWTRPTEYNIHACGMIKYNVSPFNQKFETEDFILESHKINGVAKYDGKTKQLIVKFPGFAHKRLGTYRIFLCITVLANTINHKSSVRKFFEFDDVFCLVKDNNMVQWTSDIILQDSDLVDPLKYDDECCEDIHEELKKRVESLEKNTAIPVVCIYTENDHRTQEPVFVYERDFKDGKYRCNFLNKLLHSAKVKIEINSTKVVLADYMHHLFVKTDTRNVIDEYDSKVNLTPNSSVLVSFSLKN